MNSQHPKRRFIYHNSLKHIRDCVNSLKINKLILNTGKEWFKNTPYYQELKRSLEGIELHVSPPLDREPTMKGLRAFLDACMVTEANGILAIGGGSVMDASKLSAYFLAAGKDALNDFKSSNGVWNNFSGESKPLICVPTTSGTGSEVTPYVSLVTDEGMKVSLNHSTLIPAMAIIDSRLLSHMPKMLTAHTGFDALSQCIESFWSRMHKKESDDYALRGAKLIIKNVKTACLEPNNLEARIKVAEGSCYSGLAIAKTPTTAVHSVSYPITVHFGIPHGHACALTLGQFIRYNANFIDSSRAKELWSVFSVNNADQAAARVERLMDEVGLERKLGHLGINASDIEIILNEGFRPDRVKNNPRELTRGDLKVILDKIA